MNQFTEVTTHGNLIAGAFPIRLPKIPQQLSGESANRRRKPRHVMQMELTYTASQGRVMASGSGCICDLSETGLAFRGSQGLPEGAAVEMTIAWPVLFQGVRPLEIQAGGRVVRARDGVTAVEIAYWEFRSPGVCYYFNSAGR